MTDLFANQPRRPDTRSVGKGPALFLADIAMGATFKTLKANKDAGKYPDLTPTFALANIKFWRLK
jgi:hypothetical protein